VHGLQLAGGEQPQWRRPQAAEEDGDHDGIVEQQGDGLFPEVLDLDEPRPLAVVTQADPEAPAPAEHVPLPIRRRGEMAEQRPAQRRQQVPVPLGDGVLRQAVP
jgi:hypothetical protein